MPYFTDGMTSKEIEKIRQSNVCAECGGALIGFLDWQTKRTYLACRKNQAHEGIKREYKPLTNQQEIERRTAMVMQTARENPKANAL